jgi:polysaccharide export outer membrane protein
MKKKTTFTLTGFLLVAAASLFALDAAGQSAVAQNRSGRDSTLQQVASTPVASAVDAADPYFRQIYQNFFETYRLGPEDEIAIRVVGQPDYSIEKAQVNPFGRVYHPLIGEIDVAGLTVSQATDKLTLALSEYIINPRVSLSLLTANSAKFGVLGEVTRPGIFIMSKPTTLLDAITWAGGVTDYGKTSSVTVLRQIGEGRMQTTTLNLKKVMHAKAGAEENIILHAGDTVIVHGNLRKTFESITRLAGFGYFVKVLAGV